MNKIDRVNAEILKRASEVISQEIKDPRVQECMISVVKVDTTNDLKQAKVYISILSTQNDDVQTVFKVIKNAAPFIRTQIARKIEIRIMPELVFILDDSIKYGARISQLISELHKEEKDDK